LLNAARVLFIINTMDCFVYMLRCTDDTLYTGWTNDLDKRLAAHNNGTASKYTRSRRPVSLAYSEAFATKTEAMKRECALKTMTRAQKLELIASKKSR